MPSFEVAAVGDNCIDCFLPPVGLSAIGGNAINVAVHLRKAGLRSAYFGAVGSDAAGARMLETFKFNRVDISHVQVNDGITAFTEIDVDATGDRVFTFEEFGVCRRYRPTDADVKALLALRHVHIGWLDDGGALKRRLIEGGVSVSQDITVNPGPAGLAIAFGSAGSNPEDAISIAKGYLAEGASLAVVTRGGMGSIATDGRVLAETGIVPARVFDTTGAGDTFIAGFIARHLQGSGLQESLEAGRDAASLTVAHFGGFPQTPLPLDPNYRSHLLKR